MATCSFFASSKIGINPDRSYPTVELEFPSYRYQIATLSARNGLAMQAQTKSEQLLRSCAFQDDVGKRNGIFSKGIPLDFSYKKRRKNPDKQISMIGYDRSNSS